METNYSFCRDLRRVLTRTNPVLVRIFFFQLAPNVYFRVTGSVIKKLTKGFTLAKGNFSGESTKGFMYFELVHFSFARNAIVIK